METGLRVHFWEYSNMMWIGLLSIFGNILKFFASVGKKKQTPGEKKMD